jgi:hypothetical protein
MEAMTAVVVLGVIALGGAIVAWVTWRRGADERESVQHHQHTLETLGHVSDRRQPTVSPAAVRRGSSALPRPTMRPARPDRADALHQLANGLARPGRPASSSPYRGPDARFASAPASAKAHAGRRETMVLTDEANGAHGGPRRTSSSPTPRRMEGRRPGAAAQARRDGHARVRRTRLVAAAAAVIVVGGGVWGAVASGGSRRPSVARHHASHPIISAGRDLPTTTVSSAALTPTAPTAFSAQYSAPSSTYTVAIDASAPCWVMATDPSTGRVVWAGTVDPGASHSLPVAGSVVVQLGAPTDVSVSLDGRPVRLPTGFRSPFNLTFQGAS